MRLLLLLFSLVIAFRKSDCGEISVDLQHTNLTIKWVASYEEQTIDFSIWFGLSKPSVIFLGFSDSGELNNTDGIIYHVGSKSVEDVSIDRKMKIARDFQQDVQLLRVRNNHAIFRRKMVTCDSKDYAFQEGTTQFLIGASWDSRELRHMKDQRWIMDKKFGLVLTAPASSLKVEKVENEDDIKTVLVNSNSDTPIPDVETTYECIIRRMPFDTVNNKYHVVEMNAYITPGNEHVVHHMEVFVCQDEVPEWNGNCNDENKPKSAKSCSHVIAAWAMGEGPIIYPKQAGLPIGGKGKYEYVMVEIHYNNPEKLFGIVDHSGFEFHVTPTLREYDAGIIELGLIYSDANSIPPGQKAWAMTGYCPSQCTAHLPEGGINIFGSQLHAHLTGRKLWTSHYRNGVKIGEVNRDEHYSPHWQHLKKVQPYVNVQPGDLLTTTCVYDSRMRSKPVLGGYSITDEMCVNYVYYFPASKVEVCKSAISNSTLRNYFKQRYNVKNATTPISELYNLVDWNTENAAEMYSLQSSGDLNMDCLQGNGEYLSFHSNDDMQKWQHMAKPQFFTGTMITTRDPYECPAINDLVNFD